MEHLHAYDVIDARQSQPTARYSIADKTPTSWFVRLADGGAERRVYASVLGNGASLYVFRNGGHRYYLSTTVESTLETMRDDGTPWATALAGVVASLGAAGLDDAELVRDYGRVLALAGFEVRYHDYGRTGYLTYRDPSTGCRGIFQRSETEGWNHDMPLIPSREHGSAMWFLGADVPRWTVDAARRTARETNRNDVVGRQRNAGDAYRDLPGIDY